MAVNRPIGNKGKLDGVRVALARADSLITCEVAHCRLPSCYVKILCDS